MRGQPEGFTGSILGNSLHLIEDATRLNDGHPVLRSPFPLAHPCLCRFFCNRFVRKDADPDPARPLNEPGHRNTGSLDLARGQTAAFDCLEPEVAEVERISARGDSSHSALLLLAIFRLFRHQHGLKSSTVRGKALGVRGKTTCDLRLTLSRKLEIRASDLEFIIC